MGMYLPLRLCVRRYRRMVAISCAVWFVVLAASVAGCSQESYLVTAADASLNVYDLSSNNLIERITSGLGKDVPIVGPDNRLAFVAGGSFLGAFDLTLKREIRRMPQIYPQAGISMAFTSDGRWLLVGDDTGSSFSGSLDIFDPARMVLLRRIPLAGAMGFGSVNVGSIVVVGNKAYVTSTFPDVNHPAVAVVDLRTFSVRPIAIPYGHFDFGPSQPSSPNAAATPDGKYVVLGEDVNGSYHLYFISTATDRLAIDSVVPTDPYGIVIPPVTGPSYGYVVATDSVNLPLAIVLDLNNGSPTFGQLLPQTEVPLSQYLSNETGEAINVEGSKLIVTGQGLDANVVVIDTALMLTDPSHAIVATTTVAGGALTNGVTVATVTTTQPPTAPTVTGVSGSVTNDTATTIHVSGTNFASAAQVRIGSMAPLNATVNSPTDLEVTVPVNAPAAPGLDVIVTNPSVSSPPAQQNQSGLLAAGLTINVTPAFGTSYQFAALNDADGSLSVFQPNQKSMVNVPMTPAAATSLTFNASGADLYAGSVGPVTNNMPEVLALNLTTDSITPVGLAGFNIAAYKALVASTNPVTGGSVVYAWTDVSGDIAVSMVDTNPASPTFNTVINTFYAGIGGSDFYYPFSGTATPNGKFVYVEYEDLFTGQFYIAIFDVVNGGPATILTTTSLGVLGNEQFDMYITPDNQSLFLLVACCRSLGVGIGVFDIGANPKNPNLVTTISGMDSNHVGGGGPGLLFSYQVVGNRLFALDIENQFLLAFNFDRQHGNFTQLGASPAPGSFFGNPYIAASPDGNLIYVPFGESDTVSVFDANKVASSQPALITNFASFHGPAVMAVSPVTEGDLLNRKPRAAADDQGARQRPARQE
jgi:hypothetical protein